jgi:allantoin racemase
MRILLINPNSTSAMTTHIAEQLQTHLGSTTQFVHLTASHGAPVIATDEAFTEAAVTAHEMLRQAIAQGVIFDKVLLACFGDPGLEAMQHLTDKPVVGLAQASMRAAERFGQPYSIVTAGAPWESILLQRFRDWGASHLFRGVHIIGGTGLDVFRTPVATIPAVQLAIAEALNKGSERVILGGAVFAGFANLMRKNSVNTQGLIDCAHCAAFVLSNAEDPVA